MKMNYLASPPLVMACMAGSMTVDLLTDTLGQDAEGNDVFLRDIWPSPAEVEGVVSRRSPPRCSPGLRRRLRGRRAVAVAADPEGDTFAWDDASTYVRKAPYFDGMPKTPEPVTDIAARARRPQATRATPAT
ncbi:MAG: hypothetical protein R2731_03500 [Nocardioides sp.]